MKRLYHYALLIRLDRPIGTLLLLWPTLMALWIAGEGRPDSAVFTVFAAGVFLMRSAGCAINDYADRHIDAHVERTRQRPLATGAITPAEALAIFALLALTAFALVLTMNSLTIRLSFIGVGLAALYPFTKRFTSLPQYVLGTAFAWSVPMAFAAQANALPATVWWLFAAVVLWTAAYDTMYAMVDRNDDVRIGVRSTAILFAGADKLIIAIMQAAATIAFIVVGQLAGLGLWYWVGLGAAVLSMLYQQWLIAGRDRDRCFRAFLNNNVTGVLLFAGVVLDYTLI